MLILRPGACNATYFPDKKDPSNFQSIDEFPVAPKKAIDIDILQMKLRKDRPPLKLKTEKEVITITITGDPITIQEVAEEKDDAFISDAVEGCKETEEVVSPGCTIVLFPCRQYIFKNSEGNTNLTFLWLSRS